MNLFFKRSIFVSILFLSPAFGATSSPVTINGKPLSDVLKPGENSVAYSITIEEGVRGIGLSGMGGNFQFNTIGFPEAEVTNIKKEFTQLSAEAQGGFFAGRTLRLSSPIGNYEGGKFLATEEMIVGKSGATLTFAGSLLESPKVTLVGRYFEFLSSYLIKPKVLYFVSDQDDALIKGIEVVYAETVQMPFLIDGTIDLVSGDTEHPFIFVGAEKVTIEFHEKALQ